MSIKAEDVVVSSLAEACVLVGSFIHQHKLAGEDFPASAGVVRQGDKPIARIAYDWRVWTVDAEGNATSAQRPLLIDFATRLESLGKRLNTALEYAHSEVDLLLTAAT